MEVSESQVEGLVKLQLHLLFCFEIVCGHIGR